MAAAAVRERQDESEYDNQGKAGKGRS